MDTWSVKGGTKTVRLVAGEFQKGGAESVVAPRKDAAGIGKQRCREGADGQDPVDICGSTVGFFQAGQFICQPGVGDGCAGRVCCPPGMVVRCWVPYADR